MEGTITGLAIGITAVLSEAGLPTRFKPLVSLFIAVAVALSYGLTVENAIIGITGGLVASGIWSGAKTILKKSESNTGTGNLTGGGLGYGTEASAGTGFKIIQDSL